MPAHPNQSYTQNKNKSNNKLKIRASNNKFHVKYYSPKITTTITPGLVSQQP
jgi:hypothetical protein